MKTLSQFTINCSCTLAVLGLSLATGSVRADISGFGGNGMGWTVNGVSTISGDSLQLKTESIDQAGSAFNNTPQNINLFTVSFSYQTSHFGSGETADGMVFVLQNQGPTALGANGGDRGYVGIANATGIAFNLLQRSTPPVNRGTGYAPTSVRYNYLSVAPVDMLNPLEINLAYDGVTLAESIYDTVTGATFTTGYVVDLASAVGGNTAYVRFTGGTGAGTAAQAVANFSYTVVPEPDFFSAGPLALVILMLINRRTSTLH